MDIEDNEERFFNTAHDPSGVGRISFLDITVFLALLHRCFESANAAAKKKAIDKLLSSKDWVKIYTDKNTRRSVYCEKKEMDYKHEVQTAKALCQKNYDVLFAPAGMFQFYEKKFDIFLIRNHIILKADLKAIQSKNPDAIAKRIRGGSEQASRIVLDILSNIEKRMLIDGLQSGVTRNNLIKEILLLYNNSFYRLSKDDILSRRIMNIIK